MSTDSLATLAGLDRAIADALAAGFTADHANLVRIRATVAAEARLTTLCGCGRLAERLPVTHHTTGELTYFCASCQELVTVYPAAERMAA